MRDFQRTAQVKVRVPRGIEGFWEIMLGLDKRQGEFTVGDIDGETNSGTDGIRLYVRQLVANGVAEIVRQPRIGGRVHNVYRLLQKPRRTPRFSRKYGTPIFGTQQEQIWTTIRSLKQFGVKELAFAATTDEVKVSRAYAERYVIRLTNAGYLAQVQTHGPGRSAIWRLKPSMSTGPKPPSSMTLDSEGMWDPNLEAIVGDVVATVAEVA